MMRPFYFLLLVHCCVETMQVSFVRFVSVRPFGQSIFVFSVQERRSVVTDSPIHIYTCMLYSPIEWSSDRADHKYGSSWLRAVGVCVCVCEWVSKEFYLLHSRVAGLEMPRCNMCGCCCFHKRKEEEEEDKVQQVKRRLPIFARSPNAAFVYSSLYSSISAFLRSFLSVRHDLNKRMRC